VTDLRAATLPNSPLFYPFHAVFHVSPSLNNPRKSYRGLGKTRADHQYVIQSQKEYANPETGAHVNTAEAVISQVQRSLVGVYHNLGRQHLQRYLDEIAWRGNHRDPVREVVKQWTTKAGVEREKSTTIWKPIPVVDQMRVLLQGAVGKQLRRSKEYGQCWP